MANFLGLESYRVKPALHSKLDATFWKDVLTKASELLGGQGEGVFLPARIAQLELTVPMDLSNAHDPANRQAAVDIVAQAVAVAMVEKLDKFRTRYTRQARDFERHLGIFAFNHPDAIRVAREMGKRAWRYMSHRAKMAKELFAEAHATLGELAKLCGADVKSGWGGGAGLKVADIKDAMTNGNIRECISHIDFFMERILGADLLNTEESKVMQIIEAAQLNVEALKRRRAKVYNEKHLREINGKLYHVHRNDDGSEELTPREWLKRKEADPAKRIRPERVKRNDQRMTLEGSIKGKWVSTEARSHALSTKDDRFGADPVGFKDVAHGGMDEKTPEWAVNPNRTVEELRGQGQLMGIPGAGTMTKPELQAVLGGKKSPAWATLTDAQIQAIAANFQIQGATSMARDDLIKAICSRPGMMIAVKRSQTHSRRLGGMHADLSEREKQLLRQNDGGGNWRGDDYLPWFQGSLFNVIRREHTWVNEANKLGMPLEAAVSGTTNRIMNSAVMLGIKDEDMVNVRLAAMGHLIPIRAHSYHEIMTGALNYPGCHYKPGPRSYRHIDPLKPEELKRIGGGHFPDEVLG